MEITQAKAVVAAAMDGALYTVLPVLLAAGLAGLSVQRLLPPTEAQGVRRRQERVGLPEQSGTQAMLEQRRAPLQLVLAVAAAERLLRERLALVAQVLKAAAAAEAVPTSTRSRRALAARVARGM